MKSRFYFTLIELLVVVSIIAVLASLLLPALNAARSSAKNGICKGNMRQSGVSEAAYVTDFDGWLLGMIDSPGGIAPQVSWQLGGRAISLGYVKTKYISYDPIYYGSYKFSSTNNIFNCPALPPPQIYMAEGGCQCSASSGVVMTTYTGALGYRVVSSTCRYPGERVDPITGKQAIRFESIYSTVPFSMDSAGMAKATSSAANYDQLVQRHFLDMGGNTSSTWASGVHLRHKRFANAWFVDGHVSSLGASDFALLKLPNSGNLNSNSIVFSY